MAIERKNSFHLLLSDDELTLLRLLAEQQGLNPSDFLRSTLRQLAGTPPHMVHAVRMGAVLGADPNLAKALRSYVGVTSVTKPKKKAK